MKKVIGYFSIIFIAVVLLIVSCTTVDNSIHGTWIQKDTDVTHGWGYRITFLSDGSCRAQTEHFENEKWVVKGTSTGEYELIKRNGSFILRIISDQEQDEITEVELQFRNDFKEIIVAEVGPAGVFVKQ